MLSFDNHDSDVQNDRFIVYIYIPLISDRYPPISHTLICDTVYHLLVTIGV